MFAEFELKVAELTAQGAGITADALCDIYKELNAQYFGDGIALDENIALEWARIPTSITASTYTNTPRASQPPLRFLSEFWTWEKKGREDYLGFLKGGSSSPNRPSAWRWR